MKNAAIITSLAFTENGDEGGYTEHYILTLEDEGKELRLSSIDTEEPCFESLYIPLKDLLASLVVLGAPITLQEGSGNDQSL